MTALFNAAMNGQAAICDMLVKAGDVAGTPRGRHVDKANEAGKTALMMAAGCGHVDAVKALHSAGASMEIADNAGKTALLWAAYTGELMATEILLANGANTDHEDKYGDTALSHARARGHTEVAELLCLRAAPSTV